MLSEEKPIQSISLLEHMNLEIIILKICAIVMSVGSFFSIVHLVLLWITMSGSTFHFTIYDQENLSHISFWIFSPLSAFFIGLSFTSAMITTFFFMKYHPSLSKY